MFCYAYYFLIIRWHLWICMKHSNETMLISLYTYGFYSVQKKTRPKSKCNALKTTAFVTSWVFMCVCVCVCMCVCVCVCVCVYVCVCVCTI